MRYWLYMFFGCIMYADDLVIIAASLAVLQPMIGLCPFIAENELDTPCLEKRV